MLERDKKELQGELEAQRQDLSSVSQLLQYADSSRVELEKEVTKQRRALSSHHNSSEEITVNVQQLVRDNKTFRHQIGQIDQLFTHTDLENERLSACLKDQEHRLRRLELQVQYNQTSDTD